MESIYTKNKLDDDGFWYLAQAASSAWAIHARSLTDQTFMRIIVEMSGYPAVVTPGGNLFHIGTPPCKILTAALN